jgi:hypothetical protein
VLDEVVGAADEDVPASDIDGAVAPDDTDGIDSVE